MKAAPDPNRTSLSRRRAPQANFDAVAPLYRWGEYLALGPLLTRTREHFLPQLLGANEALVLGDGDGRFLAKLLGNAPHLRACALDSSAAMLNLLQRRCARAGAAGRLVTHRASIATADLPELLDGREFDLIVTHFFLDCLQQAEVNTLALQLAEHARPGSLWVLSEFGLPRRGPARWAGRAYVRALYLAFRVLTGLRVQHLPYPAQALEAAGFERIGRRERLGGLLYAELWQSRAATG